MNTLNVVKSHKQPVYKTLDDAYVHVHFLDDNTVRLSISNNGFQSTGLTLDVHMYDTLKAALEDYRVVEYMNKLRDS